MSEEQEVKPVIAPVVLETEEEVVEQVPQHTPEEEFAMQQGWVPKDQWKGNPDEWRPAKEFNERGELFTRIKSQSKELADLRQAMTFLTAQQQKQFQAGYQQAVTQLKSTRDRLLEEGNVVEAQKFTDKLDELRGQQIAVAARMAQQPTQQQTGPSDTFRQWHATNQWYLQDATLTKIADAEGLKYKEANPNSTELEMLTYVSREMRKEFPQKFGAKGPPSPDGEGRTSPRGQASQSSPYREVEASMTDEQRGIMKTIIKSTGMTKEQYLKQYAS